MSQTLIPTSDVAIGVDTQLSSGSTAYNLLNTDTSDGYITVKESKATGYATIHLTDPTVPIETGTWTVNVWAKESNGGTGTAVRVDVLEGATQRATKTWTVTDTSYTKLTFNLTSGEVASITDPSDLRLKVTVNHSHLSGDSYVSYCEMVIPNSPCGGHEFGFVF